MTHFSLASRMPAWTKSLRFQLTAWSLLTVALILLPTAALRYGLVRDAGGINGEEVAARPEAVHGVVEKGVEPAQAQGQQEQQVDGGAQAEQRGGGMGFGGGERASRPARLGRLRLGGVKDSGWGHLAGSF